jgi:hypothetical protein
VILIDFGWAVNLNNSDGSPAIATDKNEIIAGGLKFINSFIFSFYILISEIDVV